MITPFERAGKEALKTMALRGGDRRRRGPLWRAVHRGKLLFWCTASVRQSLPGHTAAFNQ